KTKDLALQNYIQTESQKFAKDGEQYIADMLGDEIAKSAKYINDDAYNELAEFAYSIVLSMPAEKRSTLLTQHFPLHRQAFLDALAEDEQ
ncbi:MAG: hypothetical protein ACRCSB_04570, partial [Bacteroidales bacterium]